VATVGTSNPDRTISLKRMQCVVENKHKHEAARLLGSYPADGMDVRLLYLLCCVGSSLCDGLITRPEESYGVYVILCVI
jgi:hypothetical protein